MKNINISMKIFALATVWALANLAPLRGQMASLFTQYTEVQSFINPAALPSDFLQYQQNAIANLNFRRQWLRIGGSPTTALGRFEYIMEGNNLSSFGGFLLKDKIGATDVQGVYGRYAYQIRPSAEADVIIGLGLLAGVLQYRIDNSELEFEAEDQLQGSRSSDWVPDFGIGANFVYYPQQGTKFYAGLSFPQIARTNATFGDENGNQFSYRRPTHIFSTAGAVIPIGQQGFMEPSVWLKYTKDQPLNVDFNLRQKFVNDFWMGVGFGTSRTLHMEIGAILTKLAGLKLALLRVGYGFDYNTSTFGSELGSTHEININYAFRAGRKK